MSYFPDLPRERLSYIASKAACEGSYFIEFDEFGGVSSIELGEGVAKVLGQDTQVIVEHKGWSDFLVVEHQTTFEHHRRQLNQGQIGLSAYRVVQADGSTRWIVDSARPLWGEGEDFVGAIEGRLIDFGNTPGIATYLRSLLMDDDSADS